MKVYIIKGYTSEYESSDTWTNSVYLNFKKAQNKSKELNEWLLKNGVHYDQKVMPDYDTIDKVEPLLVELDKKASIFRFGTKYFLEEMEISGEN